MADLVPVGSNGRHRRSGSSPRDRKRVCSGPDIESVCPAGIGRAVGFSGGGLSQKGVARAMTIHWRTFGTTQCAILVGFQPDIDNPRFVAQAVVVVEHPRELRWVGGRSGPLEVRDVTEHDAVAGMMAVLDQRFGPPVDGVPDGVWTSSSPILPPNDATSGVPVRLVWADGRPDTLTTMSKRETQVELSVGEAAGGVRLATFGLTGERDTTLRWVYKQLDRPK